MFEDWQPVSTPVREHPPQERHQRTNSKNKNKIKMTQHINVSLCRRPAQCWYEDTWPTSLWCRRWGPCTSAQPQGPPFTKAKPASVATECRCPEGCLMLSPMRHRPLGKPAGCLVEMNQVSPFHTARGSTSFRETLIDVSGMGYTFSPAGRQTAPLLERL